MIADGYGLGDGGACSWGREVSLCRFLVQVVCRVDYCPFGFKDGGDLASGLLELGHEVQHLGI